MESILTSVKEMLGVAEWDDHFDLPIIMHINSTLMILNQLGVGPVEGFRIEDASSVWSDFTLGKVDIEAVKSYVHLKVKLIFDPPLSSAVISEIEKLISELEWRINVAVESVTKDSSSNNTTDELGKIEDELDNIISIQNSYIGGGAK